MSDKSIPCPENLHIPDASLDEWRRKAINVFAVASAVGYLPAIALMVSGQAPPNGWPSHLIVVGAYLAFVVTAVFHRIQYQMRTWLVVVAGYVVSLIHLITIPQGPFGLALPAMLPILAIVILGAPAGRAAAILSALFIIFGPLLQRVPGLLEVLTTEPAFEPTPWHAVLHQGAALIALLIGQMILLDRFQGFLMRLLESLQVETQERAVPTEGSSGKCRSANGSSMKSPARVMRNGDGLGRTYMTGCANSLPVRFCAPKQWSSAWKPEEVLSPPSLTG